MNNGKLVAVETIPIDGNFTFGQDELDKLRRLACTPGAIEALLSAVRNLDQIGQQVRGLQNRCDANDKMFEAYICPGNVNYSQRTLDEYSDDAQVNLESIVTGLGAPYVNAFPVPPAGQRIRLTHRPRPGFTPTKIAIDLNIAGGANNYLDFVLQFYLVPGGVPNAQGLEVGSQMRGNQFLNKDGTQIHIPFPDYRNCPIDVGSLEGLALEITNNGAANNLESAFVTVYYDNNAFYQMCKKKCGCG